MPPVQHPPAHLHLSVPEHIRPHTLWALHTSSINAGGPPVIVAGRRALYLEIDVRHNVLEPYIRSEEQRALMNKSSGVCVEVCVEIPRMNWGLNITSLEEPDVVSTGPL